jgi:hypothetical protein
MSGAGWEPDEWLEMAYEDRTHLEDCDDNGGAWCDICGESADGADWCGECGCCVEHCQQYEDCVAN